MQCAVCCLLLRCDCGRAMALTLNEGLAAPVQMLKWVMVVISRSHSAFRWVAHGSESCCDIPMHLQRTTVPVATPNSAIYHVSPTQNEECGARAASSVSRQPPLRRNRSRATVHGAHVVGAFLAFPRNALKVACRRRIRDCCGLRALSLRCAVSRRDAVHNLRGRCCESHRMLLSSTNGLHAPVPDR